MAADHNHGDRRHLGAQLTQDRDAVELAALQPDIEDDKRRLPRLDRGKSLAAVAGLARRIALVLQDAGYQHPDIGLVVYDQDVMRHGIPGSTPQRGRRHEVGRPDEPRRQMPASPAPRLLRDLPAPVPPRDLP